MAGDCIEYDAPVVMRDGTVLRADFYRPAADGPWPVIVARTPDDKFDPYVNLLLDSSMLFNKGHRIRIDVTSSAFPRWDRNLNTADGSKTGEMRVAEQTVHLGSATYITLPVIPVAADACSRPRSAPPSPTVR